MMRFSSTVRYGNTRRPSGQCAMPASRIAAGAQAGDGPAVEDDAPGGGPHQARDGAQRRRSCRRRWRRAGTPARRRGPRDRRRAAPRSARRRRAVPEQLEARVEPRYARMTSGCAWIAAGAPSAITRPWFSTITVSEIPMTRRMSCSTRQHGHALLAHAPDQLRRGAPSRRPSCRRRARRAAAAAGCAASATASSTSRCSPYGRLLATSARRWPSPTNARIASASARSARLLGGDRPAAGQDGRQNRRARAGAGRSARCRGRRARETRSSSGTCARHPGGRCRRAAGR